MKTRASLSTKKLSQKGIIHHLLPLLVIVVFAVAGVGYLVLTHAQTTVPDTTIGAPAGDCIQAGTSGQATVAKCNGATNQRWQLTAQTINNSAMGGKYCLTATGTAARTAVVSKPCGAAGQAWVRPTFSAGAGTMEDVAAYNTGGTGKGPKMCLVNPTTVANPQALPLVITGCDTTATNYADQNFQINTYPPAASKPPTPKPPTPPPAPGPTSGCNKSDPDGHIADTAMCIARNLIPTHKGWTVAAQFTCLNDVWSRESGWRWNAQNGSSGAYGIPQAMPGNKMAIVGDGGGADWHNNAVTQIRWGLDYIAGRYGTPCGAWSFWEAHGWYAVYNGVHA